MSVTGAAQFDWWEEWATTLFITFQNDTDSIQWISTVYVPPTK